ncbi:lamin tail domain-containing protein [Sutcliffiella horikoshii]|uniref:lamin tail domain-containing protein n=1 Tax=Sutcliffiella horikoshii TaxID=79883 RepID=UPI001CC1AE5F|nr:lamin tail domain-containing protein [Sutcliffiella horikoshii]UAL47758.1 lamin tail domain-containing protein [Sutcliffiella horikoshii]
MRKENRKFGRKLLSSLMIFTIVGTSFQPVVPRTVVHAEEEVTETETTPVEENEVTNPEESSEPVESTDPSAEEQVEPQTPEVEAVEEEVTEEPATEEAEVEEPVKEEPETEVAPSSKEEEVGESTEQPEEPTEVQQTEEETITEELDYNLLPHLLITEISPNSAGTDHYEYFELYNNTDKAISTANLNFIYTYTDTGKEIPFTVPETTIESQETLVFWYNNGDRSLADLNENYGLALTEEQVVSFKDVFPGFANGGNRALVIKDKQGKELVSASYLGNENDNNGAGIEYKFPASGTVMDKHAVLALPTPGTIDAVQVPEQPVTVEEEEAPVADKTLPVIEHTAVTEVERFTAITMQATITDEVGVTTATLFYKKESEESYTSLSMQQQEATSTYTAEIPASKVNGPITYYIEASDGTNTAATETSTIEVEVPAETYSELPLLITELSPNSKGGGTDYYEFFEVYNNTNQPMNLANYSFVYKYTDTGSELPFQVPAVILEPQEEIVFWYNNGNRTLAEFNENFGLALTESQVVEFKDVFPGFANGGNRALVIKDAEGAEVVSASYLGSDNDNNGAGIDYLFPSSGTEMLKLEGLAAPTPGMAKESQVPTNPVELEEIPEDTVAPVVEHTPVTNGTAYSPIRIEATITDDMAKPFATLFYKKQGEETFTSLSMNPTSEGSSVYTAEILGADVSGNIVYYVEASDGWNVSKTEEFTIEVEQIEVDYQSLPPFLVTEVVPDSTNVGSADGYEFIEIYNNTNQDLSFKDYKLYYRYGAESATDVVWPSIPDDVVIPSKETLVFWIINAQNREQTVADFNANYGSNLVEDQNIVRIYSDGMANGGMRGLVVATNSKQELAVAYYNDVPNVKDTAANMGVFYQYPLDGSTQMIKTSAAEKAATPGMVDASQVPAETVQIEADTIAPTYENLTKVTEVDQTENIEIVLDAQDDKEVKTVRLFYRTNDQTDFKHAILTKDYNDLLYHYTIYSPEIIAKEYVEYYFEISDGMNEVTTETYKVKVATELDFSSLRLNVKEGEILAGEKILKGTSSTDAPEDVKLLIDGVEVEGETFQAVEHTSYFAFEVSGINTFFQNGVTMGDEVLHIFDDWINEWQTITVPIDPDKLELGDNTITIRAGNKASPFDLESEDNRDDYNLRNVRLVLADGTILRDAVKNDPAQVFDMGDDGTDRIFEDFTFTVTGEQAPSKSYKWDTASVSDGEHVISAMDADEEISTKVMVDNTAPSITTSLEEGKEYKGAFTIDVTATDAIAGVKETMVLLDDKEIAVPFETASSKLSAGEHTLKIVAIDEVGNEAVKVVHFTVVNENPLKPELVSPADDEETPVDGDPTLKVKVADPTDDDLDVTFYGGYKYDVTQGDRMKGFKNANEVEPPQMMVPEGEEAFTEEDIALVSNEDGEYLITDSSTEFPYHRFDVTVDDSVQEGDTVELVWKGNSLEGRKVTMYAWNHTSNKWEIVDYKIAGTEDFGLQGEVAVADFVKESNINVLVQDEIPASPEEYDYTFVWMSDTQYYSESFPHIYERQTEWIAEMEEEMKIEYVFHTGDLVNTADQEGQWNYADQYMGVLDEREIPYGVLAGNHDVDHKTNDYTEYYKYFGADRFEDKPFYGGTYKNNRGHYDLISSNGNDYIMVYLGWGVEDEGIAWVNEVLAAHPDRMAILSFHEYLQATGVRHPLGDKLYEEVVLPNENVIAVLSGHYHEAQTLIDEVDDDGDGVADRKVYQMLADYQAGPEGGQGFMRLLHFDTDNNRIVVNTYSPYLDQYNYYDTETYPGKDEFVLDLDLQPKEKRVATDYFAVNVYTEVEIGKQEAVSSGSVAEMVWEGLDENERYWWYVVVEDEHTGMTKSDIWTFTKGKVADGPVEPDPSEPGGPGEPGKPGGNPGGPTNPGAPGPSKPNPMNPNPGQPGQPGKPADPVKVNNPAAPGSNDGKKNEQGKKQSGEKLPNTATNLYDFYVIGFLLLVMGVGCLVMVRKRRRVL